MPAVRGVAKRAEVGIVRGHDESAPSRFQDAVELLHHPDDVGDMLDDVNRPDLAKRIVAERKRKLVEVSHYIRPRSLVSVKPDRAGIFVNSAAYIQYRPRTWMTCRNRRALVFAR